MVVSSVLTMQSTPAILTADEVRGWRLRAADAPVVSDDAARIDEIHEIEVLKAALEARQARLAAAFDESQRSVAAERGAPASQQGKGVAEQVALARRVSPHRGRILLGLAKAVLAEMPWTARAWTEGRITERRALVLARETACLTRDDRSRVDAELALDAAQLEAMSDRRVEAEARAMAARLDAASVAERRRRAEADRFVSIRPAPDTMVYLTALLPVAQGVAAYAALSRTADATAAAGDPRGRGQLMADTLVRRLTGAATDAEDRPIVPVAINLVMSDQTLLGSSDDPVELEDHGSIPADLARELVADALDARSKVWLRRLYAHPLSGRLVAMDSDRRLFPRQLGQFLRLRDRFCRSPWCNARIRHRDHVHPAADGGETSASNGQGLCEACNQTKTLPGWSALACDDSGGTHTVVLTTPTGHRYRSKAPPAPGSGIRLDLRFAS